MSLAARACRLIESRLHAAERERGAVLAVIGITLVLILTSGAIAVDLSALERQGQTLQNSADAAALAGASVWSQTQDPAAATQVVADVIAQNGIAIGPAMQLDVSFPTYNEVSVELIDSDPEVLLAGAVGLGDTITRGATARHLLCEEGCFRSLDVSPPVGALTAAGTGDGFTPVSVGNKIYGVNHHSSTIECVDRATQASCWPSQQLFSAPTTTMNTVHPALIGDRIYYLAWNGSSTSLPSGDGYLQVGCWNTISDSRCSNQADLFNVGHGVLYATHDALYVFAANRDVYCFEPVTFSECADYLGGRNTALTADPGWGLWNEASAWNSDRVAYADKVYVTLSNRGAVYVHCWDLASVEPCAGFSPTLLNGTRTGTNDDGVNGRLFFYRDSSGTPQALCSQGVAPVVDCYDLDTAVDDSSAEAAMTATLSAISYSGGGFVGPPTYHPDSNREFFLGAYTQSITYCHDYVTSSPCGDVFNNTPFGPALTYGYEAQGDCLIGLGDAGVYFTLKPDMSGPCDAAAATIDIDPCQCSGTSVWPPVQIGDDDGVALFELRVQSPSGAIVLPETGEWLELGSGSLDLSSIDNSHAYLTLEVRVTPGLTSDPWADGIPPSLLVGMDNSDPHLVD
jgi:hypothetical protein